MSDKCSSVTTAPLHRIFSLTEKPSCSTCSSHRPSPNPGDTGIFCHLGSAIFSTLRHGWDPPPRPQCMYTSHRLLGAQGSFLSPQPSMVLSGCSWESSRDTQAQRTFGKASNLDIYFFPKLTCLRMITQGGSQPLQLPFCFLPSHNLFSLTCPSLACKRQARLQRRSSNPGTSDGLLVGSPWLPTSPPH